MVIHWLGDHWWTNSIHHHKLWLTQITQLINNSLIMSSLLFRIIRYVLSFSTKALWTKLLFSFTVNEIAVLSFRIFIFLVNGSIYIECLPFLHTCSLALIFLLKKCPYQSLNIVRSSLNITITYPYHNFNISFLSSISMQWFHSPTNEAFSVS